MGKLNTFSLSSRLLQTFVKNIFGVNLASGDWKLHIYAVSSAHTRPSGVNYVKRKPKLARIYSSNM